MTKTISKLTLSVAASAVLASSALALDPAITNFGFSPSTGQTVIFDIANPSKVKTIATNGGYFAIAPNGASAYMAADNGTIVKINTYDGSKTVISNTSYKDITISPDQTKLYALKSDGTLDVISTATNTVLNTYSTFSSGTSPQPKVTTITPDGSKVLVGDYSDSTFTVLNTATGIRSAPITVGNQSEAIAISADGTKAYTVGFNSDTVTVIDLTTNTVIGSFATSWSPAGIALSPDGTKIYVSGNGGNRPLEVYSTSDYSLIHSVDTNVQNQAVSVSPDGSKIYLKSSNAGKIFVIDASTYAVSEYAINSNQDHSPFIGANLLTGTLEASSSAELEAKGFTNYVNFAGGTLRATGSFTLTNPVYLHDEFNLEWDDSSTFTTVAGGTVDTNGYDVEFSGEVSGVGGLTKTGTGVLTLSGTNTYSGGTTVTAGTLRGTTSSLQGDILNNAIVEFAQSTNGAFADVISGSGELVKSGSGVVTLSGTNTYTGDTTINAGTLAITGGTTTSDFIVNSGGVLRGSGSVGTTTVKSEAILYPTGTNTLNVSGDLTFESGSIYRLDAKSNGTSGKVVVTGTANLDGSVQVKADSSGTWNETTDYEILSATAVNGTFDSVSSDLAFLDPTLSYEADKVNLTLTRNSTTYSTVANNSVSQSVGSVLDNVTSPNADMQNLITTLNGMNSTQAQTALTQLAGTPLASSITNTVSTSNNIFRAGISSKLASSSIKIDDFRFVSADDSMQSTYKLLSDEGFVDEDGNLRQEREYSSWVRVIGAKHKTDGDSIRSSTDTSTKGIQIGFDKQNRDNFLFGVSLAYLDNSIDFSSNEADGEVKTFIGGVYTQKNYDDIFLNFGLNIGKNSSDFSRVTPTGNANADFSSLSMGTDLEVGYNYKLDKSFMLKPSISANYTRLSQDGYSETGASGANLTIDKYSTNTQNLGLHFKTEKLFYSNGSTIGNLEFGIGYLREFGDTNKALDARFSAAPTAGSFSINGIEKAKNKFLANVNSAYYLNSKTNLFFSLNGMKSSDEQSLTGVAGLKLSF